MLSAETLSRNDAAPSLKGVSTFCMNQKGPPLYRLAVALRRRLTLFELPSFTARKACGWQAGDGVGVGVQGMCAARGSGWWWWAACT